VKSVLCRRGLEARSRLEAGAVRSHYLAEPCYRTEALTLALASGIDDETPGIDAGCFCSFIDGDILGTTRGQDWDTLHLFLKYQRAAPSALAESSDGPFKRKNEDSKYIRKPTK